MSYFCKCKEPGCCAFGPCRCLNCGKVILSSAKKVVKFIRELRSSTERQKYVRPPPGVHPNEIDT